jgi:hypothetical protein
MNVKLLSTIAAIAAFSALGCGDTLGKNGESCLSHTDCEDGLYCIAQTCLKQSPGDDSSARLGRRGETCTASTDCENGLICLPLATGEGAMGLGRCDLADYGFEPTGKSCWSECMTARDCCELPISAIAEMGYVYRSCADLANAMGSEAAGCWGSPPAGNNHICFLWEVYCDCDPMPWSCDSGVCTYIKDCDPTANSEEVRGCPTVTRTEYPVPATCNPDTNKCSYEFVSEGCETSTQCGEEGWQVTNDPLGGSDRCSVGECVCLQDDGQCYRKCNSDLDCEQGYNCDSRSVCVYTGDCDTNALCAQAYGDVTYQCVNGECEKPCVTDQDCNGSGLGSGGREYKVGPGSEWFNGWVCYNGYCEELGCSSNAECENQNGVKRFCEVTREDLEEIESVRSAITD